MMITLTTRALAWPFRSVQGPAPPQPPPCIPPKCIPGAPANVTVKISDLNLTGTFKIRDVWAKKDLGPATVSRNERDSELPALVAARESTQRLHAADSVAWRRLRAAASTRVCRTTARYS